jgi:hypothetical protein
MLGLNLDTPLTSDERSEMIESIAKTIVRRRLECPAVVLLEMHKPLSFIASQGLAVALPVIGPLVGPERIARFSRLLIERGNIDLLIGRIEELASERDQAAPAIEERG